jgi:hypothetical protein
MHASGMSGPRADLRHASNAGSLLVKTVPRSKGHLQVMFQVVLRSMAEACQWSGSDSEASGLGNTS